MNTSFFVVGTAVVAFCGCDCGSAYSRFTWLVRMQWRARRHRVGAAGMVARQESSQPEVQRQESSQPGVQPARSQPAMGPAMQAQQKYASATNSFSWSEKRVFGPTDKNDVKIGR